MRLTSVAVFASSLSLLSNCAVPTNYLKNDDTGQMVKCQFVGIGIVGVAASIAGDAACISQYKKQGFHLTDAPGTEPGTGGVVPAVAASQPAIATPAKPGLSRQELEAFRTKIVSNYHPPALQNLPPGNNTSVVLQINLTPQGTLDGQPRLIQAPAIPEGPALADSAISAIIKSAPFKMLQTEHYAAWKTLQFKFDAQPSAKQ